MKLYLPNAKQVMEQTSSVQMEVDILGKKASSHLHPFLCNVYKLKKEMCGLMLVSKCKN